VPTKSGSSASGVNRCAKPFIQARRTASNLAGYRELDRVSRGVDVRHWYGNCFISYMGTRKQEALPSDRQGLDWRRPVQKELIGLFDELAAFNERIVELTKQGHQSHAMDVLKAQAMSLAAQIDELRCILIVPKQ
jgi:hypothetical protein